MLFTVLRRGLAERALAVGVLVLASAIATAAPDKSGVKPTALSLPSGPGSIEGLGESFEPRLNSGTSTYSVKIAVPPGVAGHGPELALSYDSGAGNGPLGIGWSLELPQIRRQTDKGAPAYIAGDADTFLFGGEELVPLSDGSYRCENESRFLCFRVIDAIGRAVRSTDANAAGWEATERNGKTYRFGLSRASRVVNPALERDAGDNRFEIVYRWHLESFTDTSGNAIRYEHRALAGSPGLLYPSRVVWAEFGERRHEVVFAYSATPGSADARRDIFSDYRPGFELRTGHRMTAIVVRTDGALVRQYSLGYERDPSLEPDGEGDALGFTLLRRVTPHDRSGDPNNILPPLRFAYSAFRRPRDGDIDGIAGAGFHPIAPGGLATPTAPGRVEVIDINSDGLPDFVATREDGHFAYLNRGDGGFSEGVRLESAPSLLMTSATASLLDLDGDGLTDLVQRSPSRILWYRNVNGFDAVTPLDETASLAWGAAEVYSDEAQNPEFVGFDEADTRTLDIDFDKRIDVVRTTPSGALYSINRADGSWETILARPDNGFLPADWTHDFARFDASDPNGRRADLADLNGDRLQDWAVISRRDDVFVRVEFWPNAGGGRFAGPRREVLAVDGSLPRLPAFATLADVRLMDVNGDGLADLVIPSRRELSYWINTGAERWSDAIAVASPPAHPDRTTLRALDVNGNGSTDLFWDNSRNLADVGDRNEDGRVDIGDTFEYFDFVGDVKPGQLTVIDNGIGRRTTIEYASSTDHYLESIAAGAPWTTKLPFPVPVVRRITVDIGLDLDGDGEDDRYVTDITYRDGYYDGFEKEFRGFSYVEKIERGDDYDRTTGETSAGTGTVSAPSLVTRHRFLTGSPDGADNDDYLAGYVGPRATDEGSGTGTLAGFDRDEPGGREEEALKGKPVFIETVDPAALLAPSSEHASFHAGAREAALAARGDPFCPAAQRMTPDRYVYGRVHTDWRVRRLYRPRGIANPPGRFGDADDGAAGVFALVAKSVSFAFTETTESELIEANGHLRAVLAGSPVDYPERSPKRTRVLSGYDDFGNLVLDANFGVVVGDDVSALDDERIRRTEFAHGGEALARWIIDRPAVERVEDERGVFVSETRHHYDGTEFAGLARGEIGRRGLEKRTVRVITEDPASLWPLRDHDPERLATDGSARADRPGDPRLPAGTTIDEARVAHDIYGNPIVTIDPLGDPADVTLLPSAEASESASADPRGAGHLRILAFDSERHVYPVEERIVLGRDRVDPARAKPDLVMAAAYDPGFGVMTRSSDFNGNATRYVYDSFARLVKIVKPGDTLERPTQRFLYRPADSHRAQVYAYDDDGKLLGGLPQPVARPTASAVETHLREDSFAMGDAAAEARSYEVFRVIAYTSGNGQKLMALSEDEEPGRWVVDEPTLYNLRGTARAVYQPYYRMDERYHAPGSAATLADGIAVATTDRTETKFDATGRGITSLLPPETVGGVRKRTLTQNLPLEKRSFDEEDSDPASVRVGTPMVHISDGLERLIEVHELVRLDDEGRATDGAPIAWVTRYDHDLKDNLVHIVDSQENEKWMRYDGLGRKIYLADPDRGELIYRFDDASNLIEIVDAKSQRTTLTYDGVNRLQSEDYHDESESFSAQRSYDPERAVGGANRPDVTYVYDEPAVGVDPGDGTEPRTTEQTKGFLSYVVDLSGEEYTSYDARGRETYVVKRIPDPEVDVLASYKTEFEYDALDRVRALIYADNDRVEYAYNARNLVERIAGDLETIIERIDYIPSGQVASCAYGNSVTTSRAYDPRLRMEELRTQKPGDAPLIHYDYAFDGASNILRIGDLRPPSAVPLLDDRGAPNRRRNTQSFAYDDLYRLTAARYSFGAPRRRAEPGEDAVHGEIGYRYDRIGNLLAKGAPNGQPGLIERIEDGKSVVELGVFEYAGGRSGRLGRRVGDAAGPHALTATRAPSARRDFVYDANGNMARIDEASATWDFKDRLVTLEDDAMRAVYVYDWTDRRVAKRVEPKRRPDAARAPPESAVVYPHRSFELREDGQPVKYVFDGETRVAKTSGRWSRGAAVQRLRLHDGWNLVAVGLDAVAGIDALRAARIFEWTRDGNDARFVAVDDEWTPTAGRALWIEAIGSHVLTLRGQVPETSGTTVHAGGEFVGVHGLAPLAVAGAELPTARASIFDAGSRSWRDRIAGLPDFAAGFRGELAAGHAAFVATDVEFGLSPRAGLVFYHQDHLGSSDVTADENGSAVSECAYFPFGALRIGAGNESEPYRFGQKEIDSESNLQYFEARYLSGILGRFVTVDPLSAEVPRPNATEDEPFAGLLDPQRLNPYAYVKNRPLALTDPSGLQDREAETAAIVERVFGNVTAAAAIMGNIDIETGGTFDPAQRQRGGGPGLGLFQMEAPMQRAYRQWLGERPDTAENQVGFAYQEIQHGRHIGAGNARRIREAFDSGDVARATTEFMRRFERPRAGVEHLDRRIDAARRYADPPAIPVSPQILREPEPTASPSPPAEYELP